MNWNPQDWKFFNYVFNILQVVLVFFAAHFILSAQEPEGFFEIFTVKGFIPQFVFHLFLLTIVVLLLNWITIREMERFYSTRWRRVCDYFLKTLLVPIGLAFPFAYFYLAFFGKEFDLYAYVNDLWPFLLFFFLFINVLMLMRYILKSLLLEKDRKIESIEEIPLPLEVYSGGIKSVVDQTKVALCVREDRTIWIYLKDGRAFTSRESIVRLKDQLVTDKNFFATGSWIVAHDVISGIDEGPSVRSKKLLLTFHYKGVLIVPKDTVSRFMKWWEGGG